MRLKPTGQFRDALFAIYKRSQHEIDNKQLADELAKLTDKEIQWMVTVVPNFWEEPRKTKIKRLLTNIRKAIRNGQ